jgi:cobalamin-dependent methionine synthase I
MIIIGELINASRKPIKAAIEARDAETIQQVAKQQADAGADYIDVNAGVFADKEPEYLKWLVETVQQVSDIPCSIDSPDPAAIEAAMTVHRGVPMINSISLEKERCEKLMPVIAGTGMKVIALCMSDAGMPKTVDDRMRIAETLVNTLVNSSIAIFVDPLVQPVSVDSTFGMAFIDAIEGIMAAFEGSIQPAACMVPGHAPWFGMPHRPALLHNTDVKKKIPLLHPAITGRHRGHVIISLRL